MIYIDSREVNEHPEIPSIIGMEHTVVLLPAADYAFFDWETKPVGIERCAIGNFIGKLRIGELEDQMVKCIGMYPSVILLIEEVYDKYNDLLATYKVSQKGYFRNYIYTTTMWKTIKAAEIDISRMGVEVMYSPNFDCTMEVIRLVYTNRTKKPEEHTLFSKIRKPVMPVKLSANPAVPRLLALVPRLPETVAVRLIYKYDTIWNILHASDKELMEVEGMGKGLVKNLRESIGKCDS